MFKIERHKDTAQGYDHGCTWREGPAFDRFGVSRGVVLAQSPAITGEVAEQQLTETPSAREPH